MLPRRRACSSPPRRAYPRPGRTALGRVRSAMPVGASTARSRSRAGGEPHPTPDPCPGGHTTTHADCSASRSFVARTVSRSRAIDGACRRMRRGASNRDELGRLASVASQLSGICPDAHRRGGCPRTAPVEPQTRTPSPCVADFHHAPPSERVTPRPGAHLRRLCLRRLTRERWHRVLHEPLTGCTGQRDRFPERALRLTNGGSRLGRVPALSGLPPKARPQLTRPLEARRSPGRRTLQ